MLNDADLPEYYYTSTWFGCTYHIFSMYAWGFNNWRRYFYWEGQLDIPEIYLPESHAIRKKAAKNIRQISGFWGSIGAGVSR